MMIAELIRNLQHIYPELNAEEIADAIWLARYMDAPAKQSDKEKKPSSADNGTSSQKEDDALSDDNARDNHSLTRDSYAYLIGKRMGSKAGKIAAPFRSSTALALPSSLTIARALRPFARRVPDLTRTILNEEATAERIADTDLWIPVLDHALTRWLDVALVIDIGASMTVWRQTIADLYLLLACHGAFRDIRIWELDTNSADKVCLYAGTGGDGHRQARDERELIDTSGRRLTLVLTDCVSPAWYSGQIAELLASWGQHNIVSLVQVLPQPLWSRTALNNETAVRLQAPSPGIANTRFRLRSASPWEDEIARQNVPIPIVTLEPEALTAWSRVIARAEDRWIPGYLFATPAQKIAEREEYNRSGVWEETSPAPPSAAERFQTFYENASSAARRLAELLACVPISLPIVRLIQQTMFSEPRQVHVAEVFLSGLLEVISTNSNTLDPDEVQYDFVADVRESLLNLVPISDGVRVLSEISEFIKKKYGQILDFPALIANPGIREAISIGNESKPFALTSAKMLRRFGGQYASLADLLETKARDSDVIKDPVLSGTTSSSHTLPGDTAHAPSNEAPFIDTLAIPHPDPIIEKQRGRIIKSICPSCFEEVQHGECRIISGITPGKVLKEAPTSRYERRLARLNPERLDSPQYSLEMARFECPECGYLLPSNVERVRNKPLAVVGNVLAGKSHYIAAFLQQLKTDWIAKADGYARLTCLTPEIEKKYTDEYVERLFLNKRQIQGTHRATRPTVEPLIYELSVHPSPEQSPIAVNLIIYDSSGEDFLPERLVEFAGFVFTAGAFIFVADPIMMPSIFKQLPPSLQGDLEATFSIMDVRRAGETLNDTINLFERYHGYADGASLDDTPIAVMISKTDLLKYTDLPNTYTFMTNPHYRSSLDLRDINTVDQEVKDFLKRYKQGDIVTATSNFKRVKFFATSATGEPPDVNGQFNNVKPCRCLDPVLWILYEFGIIPARL